MKMFDTWEEAHAYARVKANEYNVPHGVGQSDGKWTVQMIPKYPVGYEMRLERVNPEKAADIEEYKAFKAFLERSFRCHCGHESPPVPGHRQGASGLCPACGKATTR